MNASDGLLGVNATVPSLHCREKGDKVITMNTFVTHLRISNCDNSVELAIFQGSSKQSTSDFYRTGDVISDVGHLKGDGMR